MDGQKSIEERIRERAYALWEKHGRPEGHAEHHWHEAKTEVEAEDSEPGAELPENIAGEAGPGAVTE